MKLNLHIENLVTESNEIDVIEDALLTLNKDIEAILKKVFSKDFRAVSKVSEFLGRTTINLIIHKDSPKVPTGQRMSQPTYTNIIINNDAKKDSYLASKFTLELGDSSSEDVLNTFKITNKALKSEKELLTTLKKELSKLSDVLENI